MPKTINLRDPALYQNRELAQLEFNFRVMAQAMDERLPLLERLRYLCISCTNLDEFFEIRVAALRHLQEFGGPLPADNIAPGASLKQIHERAGVLVESQYRYWRDVLRPALADSGIRVLSRETWNARQKRWLKSYFDDEIMPVLSPLGLDPAHPFPRILNKSLNHRRSLLQGKDAFGREGNMAMVRAPRSLPRIIQICRRRCPVGPHDFVLLSAVLSNFVDNLFPGMHVKGAYQFRVTRNSELVVDEDEVENLAHALQGRAGRSRLCACDAPGDRRQPARRRSCKHPAEDTSICPTTPSIASTGRST
jgi:polyphosphate kinase